MSNVRHLSCLVVLLFVAVGAEAQSSRFRIIGSANWLQRTSDSRKTTELPPVGSARLESEFEAGAGLGTALAYYFTDNLAIETRGAVVRSDLMLTIRTGTDSVATIDLGGFNLYALAAVLQYHIPTSRRFRPYAGGGAGYLIVGDVENNNPTINLKRVEFDDSVGLVVNAGFNYSFNDRWALNGDARYVPIETKSSATFVGANQVEELNLKPLIVAAGVSYRF